MTHAVMVCLAAQTLVAARSVAHGGKVDVRLAWRTQLPLHLIFNPDGAVSQSMDIAVFVGTSGHGQSQQVHTCRCDIVPLSRTPGVFCVDPAERYSQPSRLKPRDLADIDLGDQR